MEIKDIRGPEFIDFEDLLIGDVFEGENCGPFKYLRVPDFISGGTNFNSISLSTFYPIRFNADDKVKVLKAILTIK